MTKTTRLAAVVLCLWALASACTKKTETAPVETLTPEEVVKNFVQLSISAKGSEDKKGLSELCTGELKEALSKMSDEQFRLNYINANIKLESLKILETITPEEGKALVRYQVSLENRAGTDTTKEVNEREIELKSNAGVWQIESVRLKGSDKLVFTRGMIF